MVKARMKKPKYTLILELTEQEAETLYALTGRIIGSGESRDATDNIFNALGEAGVEHRGDLFTGLLKTKG